ncbi:MAG TPA: hypothetical protein VN323_02045 [Candidatus Dormibacteraeota bacterium]|jgi:hypothetical protein|nr:hypothetical protein [Candidatus Dormibacteraeota bacterium]
MTDPIYRLTKISSHRVLAALLLGVAMCALFSACSSIPVPPLYTEAELKAACQRRGGWWRSDLIPGYCEFQSASRLEAP